MLKSTSSLPSKTDQFVSAIHRRLVVVRTVEQMALGMLAGSLLAVVLLLLATWQAMPALPVLNFCGVFGLLVGFFLAIYRWPTRSFAAAEADHQLRFDDLLTTAILAPVGTSDPFAQAVLQMADSRCQLHSPSEVILRQMGLRSWSGIALATSIAATLSVIPFNANRSVAADENTAVLSANATENAPVAKHEISLDHPGVTMTSIDPSSADSSADSMTFPATDDPSQRFNTASTDQRGSSFSASHAGTTSGRSTSPMKPLATPDVQRLASRKSSDQGQVAGGGTESEQKPDRGDRAPSTPVNAANSSAPVARWREGNGHADVAGDSPSLDQVSPEDRDLVRDYFNHK